jgi:hypothetical protein
MRDHSLNVPDNCSGWLESGATPSAVPQAKPSPQDQSGCRACTQNITPIRRYKTTNKLKSEHSRFSPARKRRNYLNRAVFAVSSHQRELLLKTNDADLFTLEMLLPSG